MEYFFEMLQDKIKAHGYVQQLNDSTLGRHFVKDGVSFPLPFVVAEELMMNYAIDILDKLHSGKFEYARDENGEYVIRPKTIDNEKSTS